MVSQYAKWLEQGFFNAFPGNQKQIFPTLRFKYNLEFRGRSYRDAWDELVATYGEEHLASLVREETTSRLPEEALDQLRKLFWADEIPQIRTLESLDRKNWQAWAETVSGWVDGGMQQWMVQWSPFANLWFQCLDPSPPSDTRPEPPPQAGAYTAGVDAPEAMFRMWLEWKGAKIAYVDSAPKDSLVALTQKNMYVLKHWSGANPPESPSTVIFVQDLLDSLDYLRRSSLGQGKGVIPIACSMTDFTREAKELAKRHGVDLWETGSVVSNWMRAGAIGIAYDGGRWYVVGASSSRPRAHLTPKRRITYS